MAKKGKKGGQSARLKQQQEVAAKRRIATETAGQARRAAPAPSSRDAESRRQPRQNRYLDVSAVRIQEWLARTPDLRFRRGGSSLLTIATAKDSVASDLPAGARWNDEAGDVDGVVSVILDDDLTDLDAARRIAGLIRGRVPYCHIQAVSGTGDSYVSAYEAMHAARRDGRFLVDAPALPAELFLARPCDECRAAPAVRENFPIVEKDDPLALCAECLGRFEAAEGTKRGRPLPERRLIAALNHAGMPVTDLADDVREAAEGGRKDRDDAATQLALIYADGNRVGDFLSAAAECARTYGRPDTAELVHAVDDATVGALADAVISCFSGRDKPPVLANLAGGDDLLVTVPATSAWPFTRTLLTAFHARLTAATADWPPRAGVTIPSLSAAVIFHHEKHPFSDQVRLAGEQLKAAKKAGGGTRAMIAFLDVTVDGGGPPAGREPVPLSYLDANGRYLDRIAAQIPAGRRQTLLGLLRAGATAEFARRLTDLDNAPLWDAVAGSGSGPERVRTQIKDDPAAIGKYRLLLDIARHWPRGDVPEGEDR